MNADELVPKDLPSAAELVRRGRALARTVPAGISRYARNRGVRAERFYKERCVQDGTITYYINLGLKSWPETRDALFEVAARCEQLGIRCDRVSLTADRRMGLPPERRAAAIEETGIMFWERADWLGAAADVDIQPILNDHAIGSPASVVNAAAAAEAGFGYIGNLAQQAYRYPGWPSDVEQMASTVTAIAFVAAKQADGIVLDSYIDDGFCASFHDAATSLAWCRLHRRIAYELLGCAYAPSYGSTFADPTLKQAFGLALDQINTERVPPSLVHGDTNSLDAAFSLDRNAAIVTTDIFFTIANQLAHPTGAAVHPTPLTEPSRIPTVDDIVQSLEIGNEAERRAREALPLLDWQPVYALRDRILDGGARAYRNLLDGLGTFGVDVNDPVQLLVATTRLGAARIEELFGAGPEDPGFPRGFEPVVPTDTYRRAVARRAAVLAALSARGGGPRLDGLSVVAASGDVHEYGLYLVTAVLRELGCAVVDLGTSVDPSVIAATAAETAADAVALSTYNGSALQLTEELLRELRMRSLRAHVYVGGRLTEDVGARKSVDVTGRINELGAIACHSVLDMIDHLLISQMQGEQAGRT